MKFKFVVENNNTSIVLTPETSQEQALLGSAIGKKGSATLEVDWDGDARYGKAKSAKIELV